MKDYLKELRDVSDPFWIDKGYGTRFHNFQDLMKFRIRDVLIVSSLYDFYIFEEDGRLYELLRSEYQGLNLSHTPELTRVSSGKEAINLLNGDKRFDLIITTLHIEDMRPATFVKKLREEKCEIPVMMLAFDNRELADMLAHKEDVLFDQIFIWIGNYRLILGMIKYMEDLKNIEHDTHVMGVQSIILIEDTIRSYSALLPALYVEIINQSRRFIQEGVNLSHKNLRQRARPKIILSKNYEDALSYFEKYHETVLGIISDVDFPRNGKPDPQAGFRFAKEVFKMHPDIPIFFQSSVESNRQGAEKLDCHFAVKESPEFLSELRSFMEGHLSFGDFVFRTKDNKEVGRAHNLRTLEKQLKIIPDDILQYHSERNHFSNWLKARTEFWLAHNLRPRKVSDFSSLDGLRKHLIRSLREYRKIRQRGIVTDFDKDLFDPAYSISRIGKGSLGGKARGLSFIHSLITNYNISKHFEGVRISVPPAVILTTEIFDQFIEMNDLREFALSTNNDHQILEAFLKADQFPKETMQDLRAFLELMDRPLAVRSSGLLEDSHVHPFAGVYETYMLPNCYAEIDQRLDELILAVKLVYASVYLQSTREYIKATAFQLEEEKMAIVIQQLCGSAHENRFYPVFSGTAQSYNFYPIPPQKSKDGIVSVALGLGKMVVEGGTSLRFSPQYPNHVYQLSTPKLALEKNQRDFFALNLCSTPKPSANAEDYHIQRYSLKTAEQDGTLFYVGSTYSPENDAIYEGISRPGIRLVSFSPILKHNLFPMSEIFQLLLDLGSWAMGTPVDIEFAVDFPKKGKGLIQFNILQIRPMVLSRDVEAIRIEKTAPENLICQSHQVLGNGIVEDIQDIVFVDRKRFNRKHTQAVANEISHMNSQLLDEHRPYLLIGMGRWGSMDPWLGIPVRWNQIAGARAIIETSFEDLHVDPSQGSHFLENLNSFSVGYFTVIPNKDSFIDWEWLESQKAEKEGSYTKLLHFKNPLIVKINGKANLGIIQKPKR